MCNNKSIIDEAYIDEAMWNIKSYHGDILTELDNIESSFELSITNNDYNHDDISSLIDRIKSAYANYVDIEDEVEALDEALEDFFCIGDSE